VFNLSNRELLERIEVWQRKGMFNKLTCGNESTHAFLRGVEEEGQVFLVCPNKNCDFKQSFIPKFFLEDGFNKFLIY
jgi:hypothetical protein